MRTKTERKDKLETEWKEGLWLGHSRNSNEIYIGTKGGVVRAWAIRKKPEGEQWDGKLIKEMVGTPARPDPVSLYPSRLHSTGSEKKTLKTGEKRELKDDPEQCIFYRGC